MRLGEIQIKKFLEHTKGEVRGRLISDAKIRAYTADYTYTEHAGGLLQITRQGSRSAVTLPSVIEIDEALVSFFGFYSGDGAKGSESSKKLGTVSPSLSVSQSEPNLIRFSVEQFRKIFPGAIRFTFSLGEDSAYFMAGDGLSRLKAYYGGTLPPLIPLSKVRSTLDAADERFLKERRNVPGTNEEYGPDD